MTLEEWANHRSHDHGLARALGIEIMECREGYCKSRIVLREEHENPYGWVHGGCMMTLADTTSGIAACTAGSYVSTLNGNFHFIKAGKDTKEIVCIANKVRNGSTILLYEAKIYNDGGELLAKGDFTFFNLHKPIKALAGEECFSKFW